HDLPLPAAREAVAGVPGGAAPADEGGWRPSGARGGPSRRAGCRRCRARGPAGLLRTYPRQEEVTDRRGSCPDRRSGARRAGPTPASATAAPAASAGPSAYTGPIRAKKKSQIAAEAAASGAVATVAPAESTPVSPTQAAAASPPVYKGPIRAKKKSQIAAEAAA